MPREYTAQDRNITARAGDTFIVVLEANPTTGYTWEIAFDTAVLDLLDQQIAVAGTGIGAGSVERIRFRARATGQTPIHLRYKRSWEATSAREVVLSVQIAP